MHKGSLIIGFFRFFFVKTFGGGAGGTGSLRWSLASG